MSERVQTWNLGENKDREVANPQKIDRFKTQNPGQPQAISGDSPATSAGGLKTSTSSSDDFRCLDSYQNSC